MKIKKVLAAAAICAVMSTVLFPISASAHHGGGHHSRRGTSTSYTTCTRESCYKTGSHKHNGTTYGGHYNNDGHGHCNNY